MESHPKKMRSAWRLGLVLATICLTAVAASRVASAQIQDFESDTDSYEPNGQGANDPDLAGSPPAAGGWTDARNGGAGVIEEVASGFNGINTGSAGGSSYGAIYAADWVPAPVYANGPSGFPSSSLTPPAGAWSYQADIYTDPSVSGNQNGVPDFWWTSALNKNGVDEYLTETGITAEVRSNGEWRFTTTKGGLPSIDLAAGAWYTMEVEFQIVGDEVHGVHRIWNQAHTGLPLYEHTITELFLSPTPEDVGGPRYSWFTYFDENLTQIAVDNVGVAEPIVAADSGIEGDLNADGLLTGADQSEFVNALSNSAAGLGDINGDGVLDNFDIPPFNSLIGGNVGGASGSASASVFAAAVPEPSTMILASAGLVGLLFARRRRA